MTEETKDETVAIVAGGVGGVGGGAGGNVVLASGYVGPGELDPRAFDVVVSRLRAGLAAAETGDMLFAGGKGWNAPDGDIIFKGSEMELLRIKPDGQFLHRGEEIARDADVALVLRGWLGHCVIAMGRKLASRDSDE